MSTAFQNGSLNLLQLLISEFSISIWLLDINQCACCAPLSPQKDEANCPLEKDWSAVN